TRFIINERKERNAEFHSTSNKKKRLFWEDVARKLNEQENTNYFTGEDCQKKFNTLTNAFKTAEKYRKGTGTKKSLVGEEIYNELSTKFLFSSKLLGKNIRLSRSSSEASVPRNDQSSQQSSQEISPQAGTPSRETPVVTKPITSSVETVAVSTTPSTAESPTISRPVTPTIPSFSQSANVINVTINYGGSSEEQ
ncbi:1259_t:CDS:2, partial [Acaulospora morrowiae]